MSSTRFSLEVHPILPPNLGRLRDLADNMLFAWDRRIRRLYTRLDPDLWEACGHDPQLFLRQVSQAKLDRAAEDGPYLERYRQAVAVFDAYVRSPREVPAQSSLEHGRDLVAYFCMEYGLHESLRLYSGGLGVLAGDHCKAASDLDLPFVAVGLLFHQGYFDQTLASDGTQEVSYSDSVFADLPAVPLLEENGEEATVVVRLPGRDVHLKIWQLWVGRVRLLLLDSDLPQNTAPDREISHQLYGGDSSMRLEQEICLGVGGVRALRRAGLAPTAWHINEGHSAFQILERCRELVAHGLGFDPAWEAVAGATVFTTHTPVAAGHDFFGREQIEPYLKVFARDLGVSLDVLLEKGRNSSRAEGVNMTSLALRGSRFHNGVSRIHGATASSMEAYVWPEISPEDNPLESVTNGIHLETFLAAEWAELFDDRFGYEWRAQKSNPAFWKSIDGISDEDFWGVRRTLKHRLLGRAREIATRRYSRIGYTAGETRSMNHYLSAKQGDVLTIGFARRFTAYKRAELLFQDLERLERLVRDPDRPVIFLFAGKAHPRDDNGQEIIRNIHRHTRSESLRGHILLLEGYDLTLARLLVAGVDVWLNTPEYPLEASGTSGMKAGMNGVLNLSVLDGWWPEGFTGDNGWAITPYLQARDETERTDVEARELMEILEDEVVPLYYERSEEGHPSGWIARAKRSMEEVLPRFNAERMVREYAERLYRPASAGAVHAEADNWSNARALTAWKHKVAKAWPAVELRLVDGAPGHVGVGDSVEVTVATRLGELDPDDVKLECVAERQAGNQFHRRSFAMESEERLDTGEVLYRLRLTPSDAGVLEYRIRAYPHCPLLSQRFEMGLMRWL